MSAAHSDSRLESPLLEGPTLALRRLAESTRRVAWRPEQVRRSYCQRSLAELQSAAGAINFAAPCADLSLLFAAAAPELQPTLLLTFIRRPRQHVKFQCSLMAETEGGRATIGFSETAIHAYIGEAQTDSFRQLILRHPIRSAPAPEKSFLHYFHDDGLFGLHELFPSYDLETDLRWHCRRNSRWRLWFTAWRARRKSGPTVVTPALNFQS